ncbi:MAG: hypothetical protein E7812_14185 [Phenylobacterium sp.]|nr:MAG: hypothetical protein E7812_14185 [Phenylobacterium sp.]
MRRVGLIFAVLGVLAAGAAETRPYHAPRNAYGQPDLGGVWNTDFVLPLEASPEAPKLVLSEAEARAYARKVSESIAGYASLKIDGEVADIAAHDAVVGLGVVRGERRSRQVVEPADGMMPMTPAARGQVRYIENLLRTRAEPPIGADGPEQRPDWERCLVGQGQPPIAVTNDINPREILQTRDAVVILTEYGPDLRIIPLTDKHGPPSQTSLLGDSIAHWDGDTLVVETIRLPARDTVRPLPTFLVPPTATVEERYTRISDKELLYQFTVRDPSVYTAPWLAEYSLYRTPHPILEFACHEGNYSLPDILAGARARDRERAAAKAPAAAK